MLNAEGTVETEKAVRYLKALCNHFSHKVTAEYSDNHGSVQFSIGTCEMDATPSELNFRVQAEDAENLEGVKAVVADHLERFSGDDALKIQWIDQT